MLGGTDASNRARLDEIERRFNVSRRDFLTFCTAITATLGLPVEAAGRRSLTPSPANSARPSSGCTTRNARAAPSRLLRAEHPTLEKLILDIVSLDYHETLFAAAGHQIEAAKRAAMEKNKGKYLLVVEGAIPMKDGGIYCKIGNRTSLELTQEAAADAAAIIALGSCASWGGMPSTPPNPTGSVGVAEALGRNDIVTIPGCPSNPYNFLACVVHFLTFNKLPPIDDQGRPLFAYSRLVHENCERRAHFDAGRFALEFGDEGHRKGLLPVQAWAARGRRPTRTVPPSSSATWACSLGPWEPAIPASAAPRKGIGFTKPIHALADLTNQRPPVMYPRIAEEQGAGAGDGGGSGDLPRPLAPRLGPPRFSPRD